MLLTLIAAINLICCMPTKGQKAKEISGIYEQQESSEKLELKPDGAYTLINAEVLFTPVIEQCEYASKGKWSLMADNVLCITSENYYLEEKGYEYEMEKQHKFSSDSLYIRVVFPTDFHPVKLNFSFNHNNSKSITTDSTYIVLAKSNYLWNRRAGTNHISFDMNAYVSGTTLYKSRIMFEIFNEYVDTEKYNFLTIYLPNFDRCFFEFEPYNQEFIYIKGNNQLLWKGEVWHK